MTLKKKKKNFNKIELLKELRMEKSINRALKIRMGEIEHKKINKKKRDRGRPLSKIDNKSNIITIKLTDKELDALKKVHLNRSHAIRIAIRKYCKIVVRDNVYQRKYDESELWFGWF